jgi:putative FmdB family regulatory protein
MPIYDYQCNACSSRFELLVRGDEKPICPTCGAANPTRFFPHSASVSTGRTRNLALSGARAKAQSQKKEKDHAHAEYLRNHEKEHS